MQGNSWISKCAGMRPLACAGVKALICFMKNAAPNSLHSRCIVSAQAASTGRRRGPLSPPKIIQSGLRSNPRDFLLDGFRRFFSWADGTSPVTGRSLQAYKGNGDSGPGVPVLNCADPFWGSPQDKSANKMPVNPQDFRHGTEHDEQINLTYATLPLTLQGMQLAQTVQSDKDPEGDLGDVADDVKFISKAGMGQVPFGWYEEGYDKEVTDPDDGPVDAEGMHASYITHHNGPQYFGYVSNNPAMGAQLHGLGDFFHAVDARPLPAQGGVFFIKGGAQISLA